MRMLPKPATRRHAHGQSDHIDAWLISYADLITLLFTLFVIFVSVTVTKYKNEAVQSHGEPEHPYIEAHSGLMQLGTRYDELYQNMTALVTSNAADQQIAVEKGKQGITMDMSAALFFDAGSAAIPEGALPLLRDIAHTIRSEAPADDVIEVVGYTDDSPIQNSFYTDNWELAGMRAAHIVAFLAGQGIDVSRLHAENYASTHPAVPNQDIAGKPIPENRARNQRIVIKIGQK